MSDELILETTPDAEITALKQRADMMGMKYHPSISADKLRAKIEEGLRENTQVIAAKPYTNTVRAKAEELVRVRVTCMDQSKAKQTGTVIACGNSRVGTLRRYIPFDVEWHIPRIMYNTLKEAKSQIFQTLKDDKGNEFAKSKTVNTYSIEVLEPLTPAELKDLAQRQAMANGTE